MTMYMSIKKVVHVMLLHQILTNVSKNTYEFYNSYFFNSFYQSASLVHFSHFSATDDNHAVSHT